MGNYEVKLAPLLPQGQMRPGSWGQCNGAPRLSHAAPQFRVIVLRGGKGAATRGKCHSGKLSKIDSH